MLSDQLDRCFCGRRRLSAFVICLAGIWLAGCGYRLAGQGGNLHETVGAIAVGDVENGSTDDTLGALFADELIAELLRNPGIKLASGTDAAAVLSGRIGTQTLETVSRTGAGALLKQQMRLVADFHLSDKTGEVLWSGNRLQETAVYSVSESGAADDASRDAAISDAVDRLVRRIVSGMTADF